MGLSGPALGAVAEGCAAITRPGIPQTSFVPWTRLIRSERGGSSSSLSAAINHDRAAEGALLLARQARELAGEARLKIEGGTHQSDC